MSQCCEISNLPGAAASLHSVPFSFLYVIPLLIVVPLCLTHFLASHCPRPGEFAWFS